MPTRGPPESPWQLSLPLSPAQIILSETMNGYSSLQAASVTNGTSTFMSFIGQQFPPDERVPQPDTVNMPSDSIILSGRPTPATYSFISRGEASSQMAISFLDDEEDTETPADLIMQNIQDITSKRNASHFNIANQKGKVCRFCLFKRNYRLGEDIVGTFDFTLGSLPCVQYSVSLQLVETVEQSYKVKQEQGDKVVTHSKHHEVCLGFSHSHMVLPIPLQLAPSFTTPVCSVNYNLHFEFVISADGIECQPVPEEEGGSEWQGPVRLDI